MVWPALIITTLNGIIVAIYLHQSPTPTSYDSRNRPSRFINLNGVNYTHTIHDGSESRTYPQVMTQIDGSRPAYAYPEDPHRILVGLGTVTTDDRQLVLGPGIHTIAQFRTRDYGKEVCRLRIGLPSAFEISPGSKLTEPGWFSTVEQKSMDVNVWNLDTSGWLDPRTVTFRSRPARTRLFTTMTLAKGAIAHSPNFSCPMDSLHGFEMVCAHQNDCQLSLVQDREDRGQSLGFFMLEQSPL